MQIHGWGNQTTLLLRKLFVGAHLFYRPLATLLHCDDSIILIHFQLNAEHQQGYQFGQFCAKRIKFSIFRRRLDRKFWFGQFLEIWQLICLNITKCLKYGLQDFLSGYKVFEPYSPTGYKHFVVKRQHC